MALVKLTRFRTSPAQYAVVDTDATVGAKIGVNLLMPDGAVATTAKLAALLGTTATGANTSDLNTTDDLDEGQWNLWFTDRRAQDAVGGILADTATIDLAYTGGASITATLKDLADSGTGTALVKITRDSKGRISGTSAATTTDLTEGDNLYFTDERAQDAIGAALDGTGDVPLAYDDAGNKISAALSSAVLASLALADSATQPGDLATVATTGAYADLSGLPTLGTAAATDAADYATAAQGTKADSAVQSVVAGTNVTVDNTDPQNPIISATGGGGSGDVVGPASAVDGDVALFDGITGKLIKSGGALAAAVRGVVLTGLSLATSTAIAATDTVLQAFGKLQAQITDNLLPAGYIDGLQMQWVSGTALTLSSGAAYIEGSSAVLNVPSAIAKTGLSLAANTLYHIYPFDNAGTPDFELSTIAPAAPYNGTARSKTGDTSRRYRGSVLTDGSGNIISFSHNVQLGRIDYRSAIGGATNPLQVLINARATSSTNASCAAVVPITATHMVAFLFNDPTTGQTVVFAASDGAALPSAWEGFCASGAQVSGVLRLDSSQRFSYAYLATPAGLAGFTARVSGYIFEC